MHKRIKKGIILIDVHVTFRGDVLPFREAHA